MALLIADSGSSKTDWCLIRQDGSTAQYHTTGINPFIRTEQECIDILTKELPIANTDEVSEVIFYGAGIKNKDKADFVNGIIQRHFQRAAVQSHSDLLGAARAACEDHEGVVCILGTGSNSCYYDGSQLHTHHPSLGFILGDEGSGTHLGRKVLRYFFYQTFDSDLSVAFENKYGKELVPILDRIYKGSAPNQYLASFAEFLAEHRGHYMVENIIEDSLVAFHENHILKYREAWQNPIHFVGSIAYEFQDKIRELQADYGLTTGRIIRTPMPELIKYHSSAVAH